jgi:site-specific recombinase XerD
LKVAVAANQITDGHAKEFHEKLKARRMATTTIHKRVQFARQFMHDAVDWKIIEKNPFLKVKTQKSSVKVNEFVPSLTEYEPLVLGKVIHVPQHPLRKVIPFHKYYRWVATTCHYFPMSKVQRFKYPTKSHP